MQPQNPLAHFFKHLSMWPMKESERLDVIRCAFTLAGNPVSANSAKACKYEISLGTILQVQPTTDALQVGVALRPLNEPAGVRQVEHGLGDKGERYEEPVLRWPAVGEPVVWLKKSLNAHQLEDGNKVLLQVGERSECFFEPGKKCFEFEAKWESMFTRIGLPFFILTPLFLIFKADPFFNRYLHRQRIFLYDGCFIEALYQHILLESVI